MYLKKLPRFINDRSCTIHASVVNYTTKNSKIKTHCQLPYEPQNFLLNLKIKFFNLWT